MIHRTERTTRIDRTITIVMEGDPKASPVAEIAVQRWSSTMNLSVRSQGGFANVPLSAAAAQDLAAALLELASLVEPA